METNFMKKPLVITVCKNVVLRNVKRNRNDPAVRVSRGRYGAARRYRDYHNGRVHVYGDMRRKPLPCGARVWVEIDE